MNIFKHKTQFEKTSMMVRFRCFLKINFFLIYCNRQKTHPVPSLSLPFNTLSSTVTPTYHPRTYALMTPNLLEAVVNWLVKARSFCRTWEQASVLSLSSSHLSSHILWAVILSKSFETSWTLLWAFTLPTFGSLLVHTTQSDRDNYIANGPLFFLFFLFFL